MIAREGGLHAGLRRQVRGGVRDRLDTGLLVIGDDRHRIAWLLFRCGRGFLDELDLAIDAQNFRHLRQADLQQLRGPVWCKSLSDAPISRSLKVAVTVDRSASR